MLPSEELKEQIRKESAEPATANNAEATSTQVDKAPEGQKPEAQIASAPKTEEPKANTEKKEPADSSNVDDFNPRYQKDWEKRLHRQEASHQRTVKSLEDRIAELETQLKGQQPELKAEDFSNPKEWDEYQRKQLRESLRAEILEELNTQADTEKKKAERKEQVNKKISENFTDPKMRAEFNETMKDFVEDESDFLSSENGMLFQELLDNSPIGPLMAMKIAQSPKVIERMKTWSKDMLSAQIMAFEKDLLAMKNAEKAPKTEEKAQPQTNNAKPAGIPSTGPIGSTGSASTGFDAVAFLRKKYPERYR